jgi:hypothetical protein
VKSSQPHRVESSSTPENSLLNLVGYAAVTGAANPQTSHGFPVILVSRGT